MVEFTDDDLQGSRFRRVDLSGSRWHGVVFQNVKITDTWINNVDISGHIGTLTVNGVDVSTFVRTELEKRHPELRMFRATDVEGLRAAWTTIAEQAQATVKRARGLPEAALDESVDGEFSFLQTLRHLVFATDRWITGPVFADPDHFHPLGYPHDGAAEGEVACLDVDARPSFDEVLDLRRERMDRIAGLLSTSTHDDLRRTVASPNGGTTSVMSCIHVVLGEEWAHNQYANRDLDAIAGASPPS
jgi:hypothetical protein